MFAIAAEARSVPPAESGSQEGGLLRELKMVNRRPIRLISADWDRSGKPFEQTSYCSLLQTPRVLGTGVPKGKPDERAVELNAPSKRKLTSMRQCCAA